MKKRYLFTHLKKFFTPVAFLILLVSFTFRDMPKMLIEGEGFYWLSKALQSEFWRTMPRSLANFEVSAVFVGTLLTNMFGANLYLYNWAWFLVMLIIDVLIFFLLFVISKNKLVSFSGSLIFAVNYVAQWGYLGWTYTSFLERTITIVFLLPSFMFLHLYLEQNKRKYFISYATLLFLGIGIGQWGLLFGGAFIFYPVLWHFFNGKGKKFLKKRVLVSLTSLMICIFFLGLHYVNQSNIGPKHSFGSFLLNPQKYHYFEQISLQLSHWSNYPNLTKGIRIRFSGTNLPKITYNGTLLQYFTDLKSNKKSSELISLFYIFAIFVIYWRLPKQRPLLLTIIVSTLILLLVNIYFGRYLPNEQPGASRYLYMPTIWLSVFWSLFMWSVFWRSGKFLMFIGIAILVAYYLINTKLITTNINSRLYSKTSNTVAQKDLINYIKDIVPILEDNTLVVTPWDEMSCQVNEFLEEHVGQGKVSFMLEINSCAQAGGWQKVASESAHVVKLGYNRECPCVIREDIK